MTAAKNTFGANTFKSNTFASLSLRGIVETSDTGGGVSLPTVSCCTTTGGDVSLGKFARGSVDRIKFTLYKDSVLWTGIDSVSFVFVSPDGEEYTRTGVLETPDAGNWYYDTTTSDFSSEDDVGTWVIDIVITDGSIVKHYPGEISMVVV